MAVFQPLSFICETYLQTWTMHKAALRPPSLITAKLSPAHYYYFLSSLQNFTLPLLIASTFFHFFANLNKGNWRGKSSDPYFRNKAVTHTME